MWKKKTDIKKPKQEEPEEEVDEDEMDEDSDIDEEIDKKILELEKKKQKLQESIKNKSSETSFTPTNEPSEEQIKNILINQEQRLQTIEATLFRLKGSI